jgi:hypothetical protein
VTCDVCRNLQWLAVLAEGFCSSRELLTRLAQQRGGMRCWQGGLGIGPIAGGKQATVVRQLDNLEAAGDSSGAIRQPGAAGNRKIMVEIATVEMVVMGEIATCDDVLMLLDAAKNGIIANLKAILMYIIISRAHAIQLGVAMGYLCRRLKLSKFGKKFSPASYWPLWTTVLRGQA